MFEIYIILKFGHLLSVLNPLFFLGFGPFRCEICFISMGFKYRSILAGFPWTVHAWILILSAWLRRVYIAPTELKQVFLWKTGQRGTETGFSSSTSVLPCWHHQFSIYDIHLRIIDAVRFAILAFDSVVKWHQNSLQDLNFWERFCGRFKTSGVLHRLDWYVVNRSFDVLYCPHRQGQAVQEDEVIAFLRKVCNYVQIDAA